MDEALARDRLELGLWRIEQDAKTWSRREDYYKGRHDLPFAPEGVNAEYLQLRQQSPANWLGLAMDTPIQRLRADGFRTGRGEDTDLATWNEVWQPNKLDSRQRIAYTDMFVQGRGLMSVWPNQRNRKTPLIRPESGRRIHLHADPDDPWSTLWAVKTYSIEAERPSRIVLPVGVAAPGGKQVGYVYDADSWFRFERGGVAGVVTPGGWELVNQGSNPLGEVPFVAFDNRPDADAEPVSAIEALMPAQDAINTIRFQTLLAMQFSAYRQRVFTGYDPVVKDPTSGQPLMRQDENGNVLVDPKTGLPMPMVSTPGRVGVDRALVFPGADTKVFDMPESNLDNYIKVLNEFLSDLFAVGQVPPQYLLNRMANLSADAITAAESTLRSLVSDLQRWTGESLEQVMRLANRARGDTEEDFSSEVVWAEAETKSFAQLVDGIQKLISSGFPKQAAFEMLQNATPQRVDRWMQMIEDEQRKQLEQAQQQAAADPIVQAADRFRAVPSAPLADDSVAIPSQPATRTSDSPLPAA